MWTVGSTSTPLPVELTSFSAVVNKSDVNLKWTTATEVKNFGWDIERSSDKINWQKIGFVQGAGNSNSPKEYKYSDKKLSSGQYIYRLKQIDTDGGYTYSKNIEVNVIVDISEFTLTQNFPNPFNPSTKIEFVFQNNVNVTLKVFNIKGQEVEKLFDGTAEGGKNYIINFDAHNLASGVYYYKLEGDGLSQVKKMLLIK